MFGASWKTSVAGILAIVSAVASAGYMYFDGDPATNPEWSAVGVAIAAGWGLIHAKDKNVTGGTQLNDNTGAQGIRPDR